MTGQAARTGGLMKSRGKLVTVLLVTIAVLFVIGQAAFAQTYPRCITGCTAKDVTLESVYLVSPGGCVPGGPVASQLWTTLNFNRVNSYCVRIVADVYINNVLAYLNLVSQPYVFFEKGIYNLLVGTIDWPCGGVLELRNIQIFWSVDNTLNDPSKCLGCVDYQPGSKCVGYASFFATTPLVVNFVGTPTSGCAPLTVQFTDLTTGGYSLEPYVYSWNFGDGTAISSAKNPIHIYSNPGTYTVTLTVIDTKSATDFETKTSYIVVQDCNTDLAVTKTASSGVVPVGGTLTYTITARNNGPGAATGVTVTEPIPVGTTYVSAIAGQGSYDPAIGLWTVGGLAAGASSILTLNVLVGEAAGPTVANTACISGGQSDPNPANNCASTTTTVVRNPAILVVKTSSHPMAQVGTTIVYTYTVTNPGNVSLGSVALTDNILGTIPGPASGDSNSNGRLDVTETWIYQKSYVVNFADRTTFTYPYQITNVATVSGTPTIGSAVSATAQTTVRIRTVELSIDKTAPLSVSAGGLLTYTLIVTNNGPIDVATNVTVTDVLPVGLSNATYQIVGGSSGTWTGSLSLGDIASGTSITVTITATVNPSTSGPLANTACVSSESYDTNPSDNCDSTTTTVTHNPALLVQKSGLPTAAGVGDTIYYTITVTHHASSDGSPIHVTNVNDSLGVALAGPSGDDGDGWLESNETWTYTGSRVVLVQDPAELINTVCVTGLDLDGDTVTDCDSTTTTVEHAPVLQVAKSGTPASVHVGDSVSYTITVRHAPASDGSPVDITDVNDSLGVILTGPTGDDGDGLLEAGEVWTYTGSRVVLPSDPENLVNEVCV
ncbi:MAG: DUF11 domain-containing protein, partial [Candidatus Atribacteria bacterium]